MKQEFNIYQEKALKEFKEIWNDYNDPEFDIKSDEEAINICISIAAMFMRDKEARTSFYCHSSQFNI